MARKITLPRDAPPPPNFIIDYGHPSAAGLQAYWLFNGGATARIPDLVSGKDLVKSGAYTATTPVIGGLTTALTAELGYYTPIGTGPHTNASGDPWTMDFFLRWDASDTYGAVANAGAGTGIYIKSTGKFNFYNGADQLSTGTLITGNFYHLAVTSSGALTGVSLYIDGVLDKSGLTRSGAGFQPNRFLNDNLSDSLAGMIVFARYWTRCLIPSELQSLNGSPWMLSGVVGGINNRQEQGAPPPSVTQIDLNTAMRIYLANFYSLGTGELDLNTLVERFLKDFTNPDVTPAMKADVAARWRLLRRKALGSDNY